MKDDMRYQQLKSNSLKKSLFEDFLMNTILISAGQKR